MDSRLANDFGFYEKSEFGPLRWMAPESIEHSHYSVKSDVYAFGITILEIVTRKRPFHYLNLKQFKEKLTSGKIDPVKELPKCSPKLHLLVKACTEKDANLRPTFNEIVELLNKPDFSLIRE